jgi:hypothetical protein
MVYCMGGVIGPSLGGLVMDLWPRLGLPALLSLAPAMLLLTLAMRVSRHADAAGGDAG